MGKLQLVHLKRVIAGAAVVLCFFMLNLPAQAATSTPPTAQGAANGFLISPVRTEITIAKGSSQTIDVSIQNPTNTPTVAKAIVDNFVASSDENGDPRVVLDNSTPAPPNDFRTLVGTIPDTSLGAQQKQDVPVTISVPANANAGGYYGAIRFIPTINGKQSTVGLTASVGTLFLITVPGNLVEKLSLVQLSAAQNNNATSIIFSGNVSILTRIQNEGNIHLQPFGNIEVKDIFGKIVDNVQFNNSNPRANILPNSIRRFNNPLPKHSWIGRYTIEENLAYAQGSGNILSASASFWYFPWWFVVVVVVLIALIVGLIYWLFHRKRHHKHTASTPRR